MTQKTVDFKLFCYINIPHQGGSSMKKLFALIVVLALLIGCASQKAAAPTTPETPKVESPAAPATPAASETPAPTNPASETPAPADK